MAANYTSHVQWNSQWATHALSQRSVHTVKPWTETTEPVKAHFFQIVTNSTKLSEKKYDVPEGILSGAVGGVGGVGGIWGTFT